MAGAERVGMRDEHVEILLDMVDHLREGLTRCKQYLHIAHQAGDQELIQFFKDCQDEQRHLFERAQNLLSSRMAEAEEGRSVDKRSSGGGVPPRPEERDVTNASVKSGGTEKDDVVDEQSKESFPASDPPATY